MPETILALLLTIFIQIANLFLPNNSLTLKQSPNSFIVSTKSATIAALPQTQLIQEKVPAKIPIQDNIPWGTTEKIGDHLYRTFVANDSHMGTPDEIIAALNKYRRDNGQAPLQKYDRLCPLASKRAIDQQTAGTLDGHKGLEDYMNDENHWKELDITGIGENASYGYILSGTHLIEWVFDSDAEHRGNQLNPSWSLVCPAVSGETVDILFGKK